MTPSPPFPGLRSALPRTARATARIAAVVLIAWPAPAQDATGGPVKIRVVPQFSSVVQGGRMVIAVELDHGESYHTWPAKEVMLQGDVDEFAIRTEIGLPKDQSGNPEPLPPVLAKFDGVQYPEAVPGKVADPSGANPTVRVPLYSHKAVAFVRLEIAVNAPRGEQSIGIAVGYQACDDKVCTMPQELVIPVKVRVIAPGSAGSPTPIEPALFEKFDPGRWGKPAPAGPVGGGGGPSAPPPRTDPRPAPAGPNMAPAPVAGANLFGLDLGRNIFVLALAAAVGGFLLNLTPCVLPVIPIKILTLTQHASSKSHALALGLWMAFGVVAFWGAVGLPMAFVSAHLDPSQFIFGVWWVTLAIGLVIALMGLGIMGLFSLNLPQSVYMVEAKADSPLGSFLFGVLTAVLGLPCFGFVAGGLLAAAATFPATSIMAVFLGLGAGMAAPYLVLSVYPNLLKFIPHTGPASELVKQVMGILLLAAAAFFVTAGIQSLLIEFPYLAGSMTWWAVGFFVAVAGVWMIIRTFQISSRATARLLVPGVAVVMTLGIGVFAQDRLARDRETYAERRQAMGSGSAGGGQVPAGVWLEYSPELFAAVRASGRPVFLDFTATWCITCKALKAAVLDREPVKSELKSRAVVLMEVDCTARHSPGSIKLRALGRTGVPTWAIYGPATGGGGEDLPRFIPVETPTSATIFAELDAAGIPAAGAASPAPAATR